MTASSGTVFLLDDDPSILVALERLLRARGFEVQSFSSPRLFLARHDPAAPGCVVLDIAMDEVDGLGVQNALIESGGDRPIVFLTGRGDIPMTVRAMKAGAVSFLTKPVVADELLAAVRLALEKDQAARQRREESEALSGRLATLTPRESEVLRHVIAGRLNKQIAADLGTVEKTIKVHRGRVMQKLAVRSIADLVRLTERAKIEPASKIGRDEAAVHMRPKGNY